MQQYKESKTNLQLFCQLIFSNGDKTIKIVNREKKVFSLNEAEKLAAHMEKYKNKNQMCNILCSNTNTQWNIT